MRPVLVKAFNWQSFRKLRESLKETAPPPEEMAIRLKRVERDVVLPVKAVFLGILFYDFYYSRWGSDLALPRTVAQQGVERFYVIYLVFSLAVAALLLFGRRPSSLLVQRVIFSSSFVDGLFLSALVFATGGFDSILYWMFLALVVRNAISCPRAEPQIILNFSLSICYLLAGGLDVVLTEQMTDWELSPQGSLYGQTEPFLIRLILLWLLSACVYGVQVLFEKQRRAEEEAREFAARQAQLQAAGRVAAEVAHQLKNPLGIINTAAWSLQKALNENRTPNGQQITMIREEIDRCDRIITQLMGYARLAEGRVEKLDVAEAIDRALAEVFPPGADVDLEVRREVAPDLPPLMMQRAHLSEALNNLLQNASEAVGRRGRIEITARAGADETVLITVRDNGPGIPPSQVERVFEPYFTTKERGSGLGLPLVKRNTEMYGGTIRLESDLGKGAAFILKFPTKTFMRTPS